MKSAASDTALREIVRNYGLIQRYFQPHFARFGITVSQWGVLRTLSRIEAEGMRTVHLRELSRRLLIQPPSVTGVIDRLERLGFVTRTTSSQDRRARDVTLTKEGRQLVAQVMKGHPERVRGVLQPLSVREQEELKRLLQKLASHVEEIIGDD